MYLPSKDSWEKETPISHERETGAALPTITRRKVWPRNCAVPLCDNHLKWFPLEHTKEMLTKEGPLPYYKDYKKPNLKKRAECRLQIHYTINASQALKDWGRVFSERQVTIRNGTVITRSFLSSQLLLTLSWHLSRALPFGNNRTMCVCHIKISWICFFLLPWWGLAKNSWTSELQQ